MADKKNLSSYKETLEAKKAKLKEMKDRNKTKPTGGVEAVSPTDIRNVSSLDEALKFADSLTGKKSDNSINVTSSSNDATTNDFKSTTPVTSSPVISDRNATSNSHISGKRKLNLTIQHNIAVVDIAPKELEVYNKSTQTTFETGTDTDDLNNSTSHINKDNEHHLIHGESSIIKKSHSSNNNNNNTNEDKTNKENNNNNNNNNEVEENKELTNEEKESILGNNKFIEWFSKTSKVIERALYATSEFDYTVDYSEDIDRDTSKEDKGINMKLQIKLFDDRWSKHRAITDINWSNKFNDLIVASYSANEQGGNDPDGVVLVWSVHNSLQRPEFRFHCQSPVVSTFFDPFNPTLIIGGTYSGQIVLWDTRARSSPVQHTPLSSVGHTHPVYTMQMVGSKNAHNLVTISTDGKLCVWNVENLLQPLEVLELHNKQTKQVTVTPVAVTAMQFLENEVNAFYVGSEEGAVYEAYRHGSKQGIYERFDGHHGPVTSIDCHQGTGQINFSDLFLTASTDWTCKLWSQKHGNKPIYSFEDAGDYIYDARWCPSHPAMFVTGDGSGMVDLWNLNEETEVPILKTQVSNRAINKLRWHADGKKLLVGDAAGALYVYETGEITAPKNDEWNVFESTIQKLITFEQESLQASQNTEKKDLL